MSAAAAAPAPVRFQVVGMMTKLEERIAGMNRFCDHVRTAIFAESASLLREFWRVDVLVTVDDVPLPPARDRVESDGTAVLHMQSVGAASDGDELFPDFVYGGWWHIGLHDFDAFAAAMEAAAAAEPRPRHPQAFWIGNVEMSLSRAALVAGRSAAVRDIEGVPIPMLPFAPGDAVQALRAEYALELHGLPLPKGDEKA